MEDKRLLVFYLGVGNMTETEVGRYVESVSKRFFTPEFLKSNNCEIFLIPTRETDSRIECINPIYVTDEKLIAEHEALMKEFNDSFYKINKKIDE